VECPFCHGSNSDESRFCATCGRRMTPNTPNPPTTPPSEQNSGGSPTLGRLHSPLLSGGYSQEDIDELVDEEGFPKPRRIDRWSPSLLRHSPPPTSSPLGSTQNTDNKTNRLRSPLLESAAQPKSYEIPEIAPREEEYEALRSPLLSAPISLNPTAAPKPTPLAVAPTSMPTAAPVVPTSSTSSVLPVTPTPAAPHRPTVPSMLQRQQYGTADSTNQISADLAGSKSYGLLALLTVAAVLKIWFINQYWGQQIIVMDQIAQLLVIACVAVLCLAPGNIKPRQ
jgi:hypothetical protein